MQIISKSTPITGKNLGITFDSTYFRMWNQHKRFRIAPSIRKKHMIQFAKIDTSIVKISRLVCSWTFENHGEMLIRGTTWPQSILKKYGSDTNTFFVEVSGSAYTKHDSSTSVKHHARGGTRFHLQMYQKKKELGNLAFLRRVSPVGWLNQIMERHRKERIKTLHKIFYQDIIKVRLNIQEKVIRQSEK